MKNMYEIPNISINKKLENDISEIISNSNKNNINLNRDIYFNFSHQKPSNDTSSIKLKQFKAEKNNHKNKIRKKILRHDILFSDSNLLSLNQSFQNISEIEGIKNSSNRNQNTFKLNKTMGNFSDINKKDYLFNKNKINYNKKNYLSSTNFNSFIFDVSERNKNTKEEINNLYNYGEFLTNKLKVSNDKNTEILMKYINLKAELQIKTNQNKELENKIKILEKEQFNLNKSNQEFAKNISSVKKIIENNKLSSIKTISESENIINVNQKKINELNIMNQNLLTKQKEYENEINKLKIIIDKYKINDNLVKNELEIENNNKQETNIQGEIEDLKTKNASLEKEIEQLEYVNNFHRNEINNDVKGIIKNNSIEKLSKEIQNNNKDYIKKIKEFENDLEFKNNKLKESKDEIDKMNQYIDRLKKEIKVKEDYIKIKNNNNVNINKLNEFDNEIKYLIKNLKNMKNENDEIINKLKELYISKKERIIKEKIEKEIKVIIGENDKIKKENTDILKSLEDLASLNNEYEKLIQMNSHLKQNL